MYKHLLIPTDGSDLSAAAIRIGIRFAKSIGAKVTGLCVIPGQDPVFYQKRIPAEALKESGLRLRKIADDHLAVVANEAMEAGVAWNVVCESSDFPYQAIIGAAEKNECDLIMMASHGRSGVKALLLGSETQKVLAHSKIPVLVYR
jgi:nucleotide-binding universal stress UspA family protein